MNWLLPESALAPEQLRIVRASATDHRVIVGPAGSGKTLLLLHRARFLQEAFRDDFPPLRIFTYTNVLKAFMAPCLELLGLPKDCLSTFDAWCVDYFRAHVSHVLPRRDGHPDYEAIRSAVERFVAENPTLWYQEGLVLVDEGQDLPAQAYRILEMVARHVTVCLDPSQQIFEGGAQLPEILSALGTAAGLRWLGSHRCSQDVARFAATFLPDPGERERFLQQPHAVSTERELPLVHFAESEEAGQARLVELVRQRMLMNQRIGILVGQHRDVYRLTSLLKAAGIPAERALPPQFPATQIEADFSNLVPKVGTFHSTKGLTFDAVLLPDLSDESFPRTFGAARRRVLFVALTRASRWAYIGREAGKAFAEDPWLFETAQDGRTALQRDARLQPNAPAFEDEPLSVL